MWSRYPYNPSAYDDDWEDQPRQSAFHQWFVGVVVPIGLLAYGIGAIVNREVSFGQRWPMTLHGENAIAFGIAWTSAGVFLHCHYFWGNLYNQAWPAVLGKIISACGFIAGLGVVLIRNGVLGIH